jgi:hypothetical protein
MRTASGNLEAAGIWNPPPFFASRQDRSQARSATRRRRRISRYTKSSGNGGQSCAIRGRGHMPIIFM